MKNFKNYSLLVCLLTLPYAFAQTAPITGVWDIGRHEIHIDIQCDCTPEEKAAINKLIRESIKTEIGFTLLSSYLDFKETHVLEGVIGENIVNGTYVQIGEAVLVSLDSGSHQLPIVTNKNRRELRFPLQKSFLSNARGGFELEDIGQIDFKVTELTLIFERIYDEAYDEYLEKNWEEEMFED